MKRRVVGAVALGLAFMMASPVALGLFIRWRGFDIGQRGLETFGPWQLGCAVILLAVGLWALLGKRRPNP